MVKNIRRAFRSLGLILFAATSFATNVIAQENPEIFIQTGCLGDIYKICVSPDEKSILTISSLEAPSDNNAPPDGIMKLWDVASGREIRTFEGRHYKPVNSVCFSPDRKYILTCSDDKTMILWDIDSGKETHTYKGIHDSIVRSVAFTPDAQYALSGGDDYHVKKWDIKTGQVVGTIDMSNVVQSISMSADGNYTLCNSIDGTIKIFDCNDMKEIKSFATHIKGNDEFSPVAPFQSVISSDGKYALMAARFSFELMDLSTGKKLLIQSTRNMGYCLKSLLISSDNKFIYYTVKENSAIHIYSIEDKKDIKQIVSGNSGQLYFFKDNKRIVYNTSKPDKGKYELTLSDINEDKKVQTYNGHIPLQIDEIHLLKNGQSFLSAGKYFNLWSLDSGRLSVSYYQKWLDGRVGERKLKSKDAISPDWQYCVYALAGQENSALWNINTNKLVAILKNTASVNCATFSSDGNSIAIGTKKGIDTWNLPNIISKIPKNGKPIELFASKSYITNTPENAIGYLPGENCIISGGENGKIRITTIDTTRSTANRVFLNSYYEIEGHTSKINSISFSPDNASFISASDDSTIKQWKTLNKELVKTYTGHEGAVENAAFSKQGNYILSCSKDKTIKLWDVKTGMVLKTLSGHLNNVSSIRFLPDEKYALSCSYDGTIRLWDVFNEKEIAMFTCFADGEWICVKSDGTYTASSNGAKYLNIRTGEKVVILNSLAGKYYRPALKLFE